MKLRLRSGNPVVRLIGNTTTKPGDIVDVDPNALADHVRVRLVVPPPAASAKKADLTKYVTEVLGLTPKDSAKVADLRAMIEAEFK